MSSLGEDDPGFVPCGDMEMEVEALRGSPVLDFGVCKDLAPESVREGGGVGSGTGKPARDWKGLNMASMMSTVSCLDMAR